jgi:hypothetical protein
MSLLPDFHGRPGRSFRWGRGCCWIVKHNENRVKRIVRDQQARGSFLTLREKARINSSSSQIVAMMKATESGHGDNLRA